jgi:transposase
VREVLNGIFYVLWTGCQWQALPKDLPPKSTVHDYLELWNWDGTLERIHHELYVAVREQERREASPTVAIIDSQTAKRSKFNRRLARILPPWQPVSPEGACAFSVGWGAKSLRSRFVLKSGEIAAISKADFKFEIRRFESLRARPLTQSMGYATV